MSKNVVGFKALIGKDKVYVDPEKICAIAYAEAGRQSTLNGGLLKTAVTQIIFAGGQVLTTEKMDEVRRKIGWQTLEVEDDREKVA